VTTADRRDPPPVTLFLAGDVMTGRGIDQILPRPGDPTLREEYLKDARDYVELAEEAHGPVPRGAEPRYIWGDVWDELAAVSPAARVVNLETSVTDSDRFWPEKGIHYRMHPENVGVLVAAGIDVCVLANNHVLDFDREGLVETLETLHGVGIRTAGAGRDLGEARAPASVALPGGGALHVFGLAHASSGVPGAWAADRGVAGVDLLPDLREETAAAVAARARHVRRPGDLAVVSIHWGSNWGYQVPGEQVRFAHRLVEEGVDLVHGHSSHHPRPFEVVRDRLVLYGCGDFLSDYEGIRGYETFRGDLAAAYLPTLDPATGALARLRIVPFRLRRMRLERATVADAAWMAETWNRTAGFFGTRVEATPDGAVELRPAESPPAGPRLERHGAT
jgi:poly-gamma-glutamate capsule biosynthesis protein CapA/YwtB (metallophosphatase superfamily)